jgi:transcriptional regulator with XRE-family HTH domain
MMAHSELREKAFKKKSVKAAYEALEPEFTLLRELLQARQKAGMSQADIAKKMGTKAPAVTRLESSLASGKHSPSIDTLKKYAQALGCHLEIKLVHNGIKSDC